MLLDISLSLFVLLSLVQSDECSVVRRAETEASDDSVYPQGSRDEDYLKHNLNPRSESDVQDLSFIIDRASQSFERIKSISVEALKAEREMEDLIKLLEHTVRKFRVGEQDKGKTESTTEKTDSATDESANSEHEVTNMPSDDPTTPFISTSAPELLTEKETEETKTDQKTDPSLDDPTSKMQTEPPFPAEKETEETETDQNTDPPLDVTTDKITESPTEKEVTEDSESDEEAEVTTETAVTGSQWPEFPTEGDEKDSQTDEVDQTDDCIYKFPSEQITGVPQSKCATWLLENYHKHKSGWKSCSSTFSQEVLNAPACFHYQRDCETSQRNLDCCNMVACQLHKQTYFYPYNDADKDEKKDVVINDGATQSPDATIRTPPPTQPGPGDLLKLSCMNRDLSYMDNSCIKWMFKLYHMVKKGQGWQQCSSFDYSRHSTKGCGKLKKKCDKFERRGDNRRANEYCCASVYCYGRKRHFLRLA